MQGMAGREGQQKRRERGLRLRLEGMGRSNKGRGAGDRERAKKTRKSELGYSKQVLPCNLDS